MSERDPRSGFGDRRARRRRGDPRCSWSSGGGEPLPAGIRRVPGRRGRCRRRRARRTMVRRPHAGGPRRRHPRARRGSRTRPHRAMGSSTPARPTPSTRCTPRRRRPTSSTSSPGGSRPTRCRYGSTPATSRSPRPAVLEPAPDGAEAAHAWWASPRPLLAEWQAGARTLYWPTYATMLELAACESAEAIADAHVRDPRARPTTRSCGFRGRSSGRTDACCASCACSPRTRAPTRSRARTPGSSAAGRAFPGRRRAAGHRRPVVVIDPGPDDPAHLDEVALRRRCSGRSRARDARPPRPCAGRARRSPPGSARPCTLSGSPGPSTSATASR